MTDKNVTPSAFGALEAAHRELKIRMDQLQGSSLRVERTTERIDVSLHEHFKALLDERNRQYLQRFDAQEKAVIAAMHAAQQAVLKAEAASEKRFDSVNEFRQTLSDQAARLMPRAEGEQVEKALSEKLDLMKQRLDKMEGSAAGLSKGWAILVGAIGLFGTTAAIFFALAGKFP